MLYLCLLLLFISTYSESKACAMSNWKGKINWKSKSSFYWSEHKTRWLSVTQKIQWVLQNTTPESAGWTVVKGITADKLKTRIKNLKTWKVHLVSKTSDDFYVFLREDDWLGPVVILRKHFTNSNKKERMHFQSQSYHHGQCWESQVLEQLLPCEGYLLPHILPIISKNVFQ